jgi:hypothetical protein
MKVNYDEIYEVLAKREGKVISAAQLAFDLKVDRIYGATMTKLVREGKLEPAFEKGYYWVKSK